MWWISAEEYDELDAAGVICRCSDGEAATGGHPSEAPVVDVSPEQREALAKELGYQIASVRHGQSVTASDLADRLMPWLAAVVRAAKAGGWDEGALAEAERIRQAERGFESLRVNPYREGSK